MDTKNPEKKLIMQSMGLLFCTAKAQRGYIYYISHKKKLTKGLKKKELSKKKYNSELG